MVLLLALSAHATPRFPIEPAPAVKASGGIQYLGFGMAPLGDLDGDGFGEVALGGYARYGEPAITLIEGDANGLDPGVDHRYDTAADRLCCWSPTAADLDGDGDRDLVVGVVSDMSPGSDSHLSVLLGSSAGLEATASTEIFDPYSIAERSSFGTAITNLGDLDGDGDEEIATGANFYSKMDPGEVHLFWGGSSLSATADLVLIGETAHAYFGESLAGLGDVDGDGHDDFVVGNPRLLEPAESGTAWLYSGGATPTFVEELTVSGVSEEFGDVVAAGGDINGDGHADVLIPDTRSCEVEDQETWLYVFFGSVDPSAGDYERYPCLDANCDAFANDLEGVGDVDGDGFGDVIVGNASFGVNVARLIPGSAAGLDTAAAMPLGATEPTVSYGDQVSPAGDLDGDGWPDVLVADTSFAGSAGLVEVWMRPHEERPEDTGDSAEPVDTDVPVDTAGPGDTGSPEDSTAPADSDDVQGTPDTGKSGDGDGCGCTTTRPAWSWALPLLLVVRRRSTAR